jgi:AraC-like DNA-binding protein
VRIHAVTEQAWLDALREPRCQIEIGRVILGQTAADWRTQLRAPGWLSETHYAFWAESGPLIVETQTTSFQADPRTLLWFPPGAWYTLHLLRASWLGRFRFRVLRGQRDLTPWTEAQVIPQARFVREHLQRWFLEIHRPGSHAEALARALLVDWSVACLRASERGGERQAGLAPWQASLLVEYLLRHAAERPTPADLAALLGLSPAYFARLFKAAFGVSPRRWIMEERMRLAARIWLEGSLNVAEVARALGYEDQHFFSRQFRAVHGASPMQYKRARG